MQTQVGIQCTMSSRLGSKAYEDKCLVLCSALFSGCRRAPAKGSFGAIGGVARDGRVALTTGPEAPAGSLTALPSVTL